MSPADLDTAAQTLADNRVQPAPLPLLPDALKPGGEPEAYRLQALLHERLSAAGFGTRTGYKIGCTTQVMQEFMNIDHPCAGGVMAETIHCDHVQFRYDSFSRIGVECEIAVRLGQNLTANEAPFDRENVAPAIAACMASIELVDDRYDDFRRFDIETLIANDFFNAGCVLGQERSDWQRLELGALEGRMRVNGSEIGRGVGADILGHPLEALAWLANLLATQNRSIMAGEFVTLGSVVQTHWVTPGDVVAIEIEGLGPASVEFLASPLEAA